MSTLLTARELADIHCNALNAKSGELDIDYFAESIERVVLAKAGKGQFPTSADRIAYGATSPSAVVEAPAPRLQGGMDNEELREAWNRKLPGIEPTDRELTAFALGVEVGDQPSRTYFAERNSARDAWDRRRKQCEALEADAARLREALAAIVAADDAQALSQELIERGRIVLAESATTGDRHGN